MSAHDLTREPLPDPRWKAAFIKSRPYAEQIADMAIADNRIMPCNRDDRIGRVQSSFACDYMLGRSVERTALIQVSGLRDAVKAVGEIARACNSVGVCKVRRAA